MNKKFDGGEDSVKVQILLVQNRYHAGVGSEQNFLRADHAIVIAFP